ncbi:MAG TPA: DNA lyase [Solirubrobacteraceae bacterium]|nr:DNA lyase [Solirubrobacteraceae bacterium]
MGRARLTRIRARLRSVYGVPAMPPHFAPLDELVLTVLSQSTNDRNRDVAYLRLRERFGDSPDPCGAAPGGVSWDAVRDAPVEEVEEAIRPGGISKVKSVRIQAILEAIAERPPGGRGADPLAAAALPPDGRGADPLAPLARADVATARDYLTALPGVGRKTAACVLLFSFGARDVPVDTHVSRVGTRLALLPEKASFDVLHDRMLEITPHGAELELHVNLLRHGRRTCHSQRPACERCILRRSCPSSRV